MQARSRIEALVAQTFGVPIASICEIEAGLGQRRFFRVHLERAPAPAPETLVARLEASEDPATRPVGRAPEPALEPLRSLLEAAGLPVPACYATTSDLALLEDVGDTSLEAAVAEGLPADTLAELYREACGWLPRLQRIPDGAPAFDRHLDEALFRYKAELFIEWALPWARRAAGPRTSSQVSEQAEATAVRDAFAWIARECLAGPQRLAHRDYKAANLHLRPGAVVRPRLVMIDLQGAFLAPPEYDLVCLLRDSQVELPETLVQSLLAEVRGELPDAPDPSSFERRFTLLTLTRNGKDLARYLYAAHARQDARYLPLLPRAARTLKAAAESAAPWDPVLARLEEIMATLPESSCAP